MYFTIWGEIFLKKKYSFLFILTLSFVFLLSACGSEPKEAKEVKYSGIMKDKKNTISYLVNNNSDENSGIGKDGEISKYIISENGKTVVYNDDSSENPSHTNLGKMLKMSDDEKLDYIKKRDKESFEKEKSETLQTKKDRLDNVQNYLDNAKEKNDNKTIEEMNGKTAKEFYTDQVKSVTKDVKKISNIEYKEPLYNDLEIKVETDESGNNTKEEFLNVGSHGFDVDSKNGIYRNDKEASKGYGHYFSNVLSPMEIYDKKVSGLSNIDYIENNNDYSTPDYESYKYLVTEVGEKTEKFEMDQPDDDLVKERD